ncbi:MAG: HD domain-containing phosphohydrolase [Pseudomonadota bacterium]
MNEPFLVSLLHALGIFVVERSGPSGFTAHGAVPTFCEWFTVHPDSADLATINFEGSAFLTHFLEEAEDFWMNSGVGPLESGPWIESDDKHGDFPLEATALCLGERKLLIVRLLGRDFLRRREMVQTARERLLLQRRLEQLVKERTRALSLTQEVTIQTLAALAETRDSKTGGHIKRTQMYVKLLAEHLQAHPKFNAYLSDESVELLCKSAPLHDIGKVGAPDRILLKPGLLTPDEFEEMKKHVTIGRDALAAAEEKLGGDSFLRIAAEMAYTHHERWDGTGYPRGLKGEEIPVTGRLMAVADVYDALIDERVYKSRFPHEDATAVIAELKGTHFDPDVVDAFLELQEEFRRTSMEFADSYTI